MLKRSIIVCVAVAAGGCGSGGATPTATNNKPDSPFANAAAAQGWSTSTGAPAAPSAPAPTAPQPAAPAAAAQSTALPNIPAGARFSLFCESYNGADHVQFATNVKNLLVKNTKLKDWYVIHRGDESSLYHGFYTEVDEKAAGNDKTAEREADRAQRDRTLVQSLPDPTTPDRKMFPRSLFVPLDAPDPDAPPAWNLSNAPGYWTVQIAAFTGAERKQAAVESVRQARAMNVPAFYYHGENISSVCIGSWDRAAVKEQDVGRAGNVDEDKGARDNGEFIANFSGQPISESMKNQVGPDGKPIRVLQAKIEVVDPSLLATLKQYPAQAVDGMEVPLQGTDANGRKVTRPRPSMIVEIPRGQKTGATASQTNEPAPTLLNPNAGGGDLGARLKGIGQ